MHVCIHIVLAVQKVSIGRAPLLGVEPTSCHLQYIYGRVVNFLCHAASQAARRGAHSDAQCTGQGPLISSKLHDIRSDWASLHIFSFSHWLQHEAKARLLLAQPAWRFGETLEWPSRSLIARPWPRSKLDITVRIAMHNALAKAYLQQSKRHPAGSGFLTRS